MSFYRPCPLPFTRLDSATMRSYLSSKLKNPTMQAIPDGTVGTPHAVTMTSLVSGVVT